MIKIFCVSSLPEVQALENKTKDYLIKLLSALSVSLGALLLLRIFGVNNDPSDLIFVLFASL